MTSVTVSLRDTRDLRATSDAYWLMRYRARLAMNPKMRRAEESLAKFHMYNPLDPALVKAMSNVTPLFCRRQAD